MYIFVYSGAFKFIGGFIININQKNLATPCSELRTVSDYALFWIEPP